MASAEGSQASCSMRKANVPSNPDNDATTQNMQILGSMEDKHGARHYLVYLDQKRVWKDSATIGDLGALAQFKQNSFQISSTIPAGTSLELVIDDVMQKLQGSSWDKPSAARHKRQRSASIPTSFPNHRRKVQGEEEEPLGDVCDRRSTLSGDVSTSNSHASTSTFRTRNAPSAPGRPNMSPFIIPKRSLPGLSRPTPRARRPSAMIPSTSTFGGRRIVTFTKTYGNPNRAAPKPPVSAETALDRDNANRPGEKLPRLSSHQRTAAKYERYMELEALTEPPMSGAERLQHWKEHRYRDGGPYLGAYGPMPKSDPDEKDDPAAPHPKK
ncbi:MAG: hypothetical protein M1833_003316 [Piccolia ochrophora]|nr:MAG: hypothetical protein M1833_003316 [Piccolia ochrophora]